MEAYYSTWHPAAFPAGAPAAPAAHSASSPPRGRQEAEEGRDGSEAQAASQDTRRHGARATGAPGDSAQAGKDDEAGKGDADSSGSLSLAALGQDLYASEPAALGAHVEEEETEEAVLCEETVRRWTKSLAAHVDAFAPPLHPFPSSSFSLPDGR